MKKTILSLSIMALLSTSAFAGNEKTDFLTTATVGMSGILLTALAPAVGAGLLLTGTSADATTRYKNKELRKQIQELVYKDSQEFYLDGSISEALAQGIAVMKQADQTITDAEAVDLLVQTVETF